MSLTEAFDLVDEAASKLNIEMNSLPESIDKEKRRLLQLEIEKASLEKEKDSNSIVRLKKCQFEIENIKQLVGKDLTRYIEKLDKKMQNYASKLEFEEAAKLRDEINRLKARQVGIPTKILGLKN